MKSCCKSARAGALLIGIAVAGGAQAMRVAGPAGAPTPVTHAAVAAPTPGAAAHAPTLDLAAGVVQAVDLKKGDLRLAGRVVGLRPSGLRVIGADGHAESGAGALRPGMHIRFALEPATAAASAEPRRIVLIYIERRP